MNSISLSARPSLCQVMQPGSMSGQIFADLCDKLLIAEAERAGYEFRCYSDRAGDYGGLDAYSEPGAGGNFSGVEGRIGFQYKFFPSESQSLSPDQKRKIKDSIETAARPRQTPIKGLQPPPDIKEWVLVTPEDFNRHQQAWFDGLQESINPPFTLVHWGKKRLAALVELHPQTALHLYPELVPGVRPPTFQDMCASLVKQIGSKPHHTHYHIGIRTRSERLVHEELTAFVEDDESTLFCLLGEYGTGKTTALERLCLTLARNIRVGRPEARIPIFVRLRYLTERESPRHGLLSYLKHEYGLSIDIATLQHLNSSGRLVFIFDGLDELPVRTSGSTGVLTAIYHYLSPKGKIVLSCRSEYFADAVDERVSLFGVGRPHFLAASNHPKEVRSLGGR